MTRRNAAFSLTAITTTVGFTVATWHFRERARDYPVDWRPLDERAKERLTGDEGVTLLLVRMDWGFPWQALEEPFRTDRFRSLMRRHEIEPVLVDGSDWQGEEIAWVWKRYTHSKYPRLILNVRGRTTQTHFFGEDLGRLEDRLNDGGN